ncbi:related to Mannose 6-phosphate receptor-like protein 1 [Saccharomycodes ludwigii]|uniref:Related to Mannose 6-phosphate receptor-like protein 1 n=1 Tax=Saccharomycodes ludwigii TaxID=36035 RepID=A0A376BAK8_9ASCO|nr:related to Mannose 6-phosphate receptor-like protein 1 [Saccharomycodes ludwigii]
MRKSAHYTIITIVVVILFINFFPRKNNLLLENGNNSNFTKSTTITTSSDSKLEKSNDKDKEDELFCAINNPITGSYIDLSQLSTTPNSSPDTNKKRKNELPQQHKWLVKGWDYTSNFTLGICSSPLEEADDDSEPNIERLDNHTGAYYYDPKDDFTKISIGEVSTKPKFVGKKLLLEYDNGDVCPNGIDRKSTLLNFVCDKDISQVAQISFLGQLHNCSYFFEVRSVHACPTSNKKTDINVIGIFFFILCVFIIVEYFRRRLNKWFLKAAGSGNGSTLPGINANSVESRAITPRWASIESEPKWKTLMKNVFDRAFNNKPTQDRIRLHSNTNEFSRSNEELFRDIEAQNDLLDSLNVQDED